jgi:hypothetical protein
MTEEGKYDVSVWQHGLRRERRRFDQIFALYFQALELGIAEGILLRCREKAGP